MRTCYCLYLQCEVQESVNTVKGPVRTGRADTSGEIKFSGANGDREMFIFSVQLTKSRIGNITRLIHTLLYVTT